MSVLGLAMSLVLQCPTLLSVSMIKVLVTITFPQIDLSVGTHGIVDVMVTAIEGGTVRAAVTYTPDCNAALGTLFSFTFITDTGTVDFTRSILLPVDRNSSLSSTLPIHLSPGQYRVHVYDIEQEGILNNGTNYPAQELNLTLDGINQGETLNWYAGNWPMQPPKYPSKNIYWSNKIE